MTMPLGIRQRLSSSSGMFSRPDGQEESAKSVIFISSEGADTERDYFNHLHTILKSRRNDLPLVIHVLEHDKDCASDPAHVFQLLEECAAIREDQFLFEDTKIKLSERFTDERVYRYFNHPATFSDEDRREFKEELIKAGISVDYYQWLKQVGDEQCQDVFAVVLDRDTESHSPELLAEIQGRCRDKGFRFCLTNPCFDFWLLLHLCNISTVATDRQLKLLLRNKKLSHAHTYVSRIVSKLAHHAKHIGLDKFKTLYFPRIGDACRHANQFASSGEAVISSLGTTVPVLIEEIFSLAGEGLPASRSESGGVEECVLVRDGTPLI